MQAGGSTRVHMLAPLSLCLEEAQKGMFVDFIDFILIKCRYITYFLSKILLLRKCGVDPVIVSYGAAPSCKEQTQIQRLRSVYMIYFILFIYFIYLFIILVYLLLVFDF